MPEHAAPCLDIERNRAGHMQATATWHGGDERRREQQSQTAILFYLLSLWLSACFVSQVFLTGHWVELNRSVSREADFGSSLCHFRRDTKIHQFIKDKNYIQPLWWSMSVKTQNTGDLLQPKEQTELNKKNSDLHQGISFYVWGVVLCQGTPFTLFMQQLLLSFPTGWCPLHV